MVGFTLSDLLLRVERDEDVPLDGGLHALKASLEERPCWLAIRIDCRPETGQRVQQFRQSQRLLRWHWVPRRRNNICSTKGKNRTTLASSETLWLEYFDSICSHGTKKISCLNDLLYGYNSEACSSLWITVKKSSNPASPEINSVLLLICSVVGTHLSRKRIRQLSWMNLTFIEIVWEYTYFRLNWIKVHCECGKLSM